MDLSLSANMTLMLLIAAAVGAASAAILWLRAASMTSPEELAAKGLAAVRKERLSFYGVLVPLVVGFVAYYVFLLLHARWPAAAETIFLVLALGAAAALTGLSARAFPRRGLVEMAALHLIYVVGFGLVMPRLLVF